MKLMNPLVTISIPLYKCENFLEGCLNSVLKQTYANIEVTLINDNTPDNSVQIAKDFITKHQLETWEIIHLEKNSGLSVVINKGIDTAKGKYLFFLDSDDTITPDCIQKLVEVGERTGAEMVVSQIECEQFKTGHKHFCMGQLNQLQTIVGNEQVFEAFVEGKILSSAVNKLFVVNYLQQEKIYFVPGLFAQDELWTFQLTLRLNSVAFQPDTTYTYYLHDKSVIHNRGKRNFDNWFTIGQYIDKEYKNETTKARKNLILKYLINYKSLTLQMNWKAQKNKELWKESYHNYKTLSSLPLIHYFSKDYSNTSKKLNLFNQLPTELGFMLFKWRYER